MTTIFKLRNNLPTLEGRTLRIGTEVAVTEEVSTGRHNTLTRVIVVANARYHVREEDLGYAQGEP